MSIETVLIDTELDAGFGISIPAELHVTVDVTAPDVAPHDKYGMPGYPDSPLIVEILQVTLAVGSGIKRVTQFDHASIETAVKEALAERKQRDAEYAAEMKRGTV